MALGLCSICSINQANYKCPKCLIVYCSLPCYKSLQHVHDAEVTAKSKSPNPKTTEHLSQPSLPISKDQLLAKIAQDAQIKSLLASKSLQVHLAVIVKLLEDSLLTNEPMAENRREIANMRLCELRMGGPDENLLVEEFVQRVLQLQQEIQTESSTTST